MDAAELIRKLIDVLSQINQPQQPNHAQLTVVAQPEPQNPFPEDEHINDETGGVMVPPLQQKMELLKKMAGVDSVYDQPEEVEDELEIIKRNAGIPVMVSVASEDNDALEN
jgi:hypothetical protein